MTITICSSASFYEHVAQLQKQLQTMGYEVLIPDTAEKMKAAGTFQLQGFKPPVGDIAWKQELMNGHFDKVEAGDVCLVVNDEKNGVSNYIGGNVLMEMTLAYRAGKPIVILNEIPTDSSFAEEIFGVDPIVLHGNLRALPDELAKRGLQPAQ